MEVKRRANYEKRYVLLELIGRKSIDFLKFFYCSKFNSSDIDPIQSRCSAIVFEHFFLSKALRAKEAEDIKRQFNMHDFY